MASNDGGPAHPIVWQDAPYGGMSLRDYFAGQAMVTRLENYSESWKELAESAYQIADAMLTEREKGKE